jgi:hypothetical protein
MRRWKNNYKETRVLKGKFLSLIPNVSGIYMIKLPYEGRENDELASFLMVIIDCSPCNHNQLGRMRRIEKSNRYILKVSEWKFHK